MRRREKEEDGWKGRAGGRRGEGRDPWTTWMSTYSCKMSHWSILHLEVEPWTTWMPTHRCKMTHWAILHLYVDPWTTWMSTYRCKMTHWSILHL